MSEGTDQETRAISATLPSELIEQIDEFCDDRVMGRTKFIELASRRLLATAPPLPGRAERPLVDPIGDRWNLPGVGRVTLTVDGTLTRDNGTIYYPDEGPGTVEGPLGRSVREAHTAARAAIDDVDELLEGSPISGLTPGGSCREEGSDG